jgi:hypothetical protein
MKIRAPRGEELIVFLADPIHLDSTVPVPRPERIENKNPQTHPEASLPTDGGGVEPTNIGPNPNSPYTFFISCWSTERCEPALQIAYHGAAGAAHILCMSSR